jgi:hypothetical protein
MRVREPRCPALLGKLLVLRRTLNLETKLTISSEREAASLIGAVEIRPGAGVDPAQ